MQEEPMQKPASEPTLEAQKPPDFTCAVPETLTGAATLPFGGAEEGPVHAATAPASRSAKESASDRAKNERDFMKVIIAYISRYSGMIFTVALSVIDPPSPVHERA